MSFNELLLSSVPFILSLFFKSSNANKLFLILFILFFFKFSKKNPFSFNIAAISLYTRNELLERLERLNLAFYPNEKFNILLFSVDPYIGVKI